jgi:hypothetical protein
MAKPQQTAQLSDRECLDDPDCQQFISDNLSAAQEGRTAGLNFDDVISLAKAVLDMVQRWRESRNK